jgi:hypothetical protein
MKPTKNCSPHLSFEDKETLGKKHTSIKDKETVGKRIQAYRTFRQTTDSIAIEMGISQVDIDILNRWVSLEKVKGSRPS